MAGVKNILSKSFQSSNAVNVVKATLLALQELSVTEERRNQRLSKLRAAAEKQNKSR